MALQAALNPVQPSSDIDDTPATEAVAEVRHAGEFVNADSPRPHMVIAEEQVSLRLGYGAPPYPVPPTGLRNPDYQEAQHLAAQQASLGAAPITTKSIISTDTNDPNGAS